ncbi:MAG: Uma2 family endonuclease [Acidobacteriota bacterium]|nr:Uma2 family endonuclease [Acidobacteriota bacterium]
MATATNLRIEEGLTIEDFENLPDALAHNHELVDGELIDVSGNIGEHNELRDLLAVILLPFVTERKLGKVITEQEYDFNGNAYGPDVSFIDSSKLHLFDRKRRVQLFVPDLAIEIVSQNDKFESLMKKAKRYRECGTRDVWIFSVAEREALRYVGKQRTFLDENAEFSSDQIPGFAIRIGDLLDRI